MAPIYQISFKSVQAFGRSRRNTPTHITQKDTPCDNKGCSKQSEQTNKPVGDMVCSLSGIGATSSLLTIEIDRGH